MDSFDTTVNPADQRVGAPGKPPPLIVIIASVVYPEPGLSMVIPITCPEVLIIAVIDACSIQVPVTITTGAEVYPAPPTGIVTASTVNK